MTLPLPIPFVAFLKLTASSRPSAPPGDSAKCPRFIHWLKSKWLFTYLLTYLLTYIAFVTTLQAAEQLSLSSTSGAAANQSLAAVKQIRSAGEPLADFVTQLDDHPATIPDSVTAYYLSSAGFEATDPRLVRLVSVAAQKFVSDVANDALQHCRMRMSTQAAKKQTRGGTDKQQLTLTMDDLTPALAEYGINVTKPQYYV